jgi:basic membrane protein A and related proteins
LRSNLPVASLFITLAVTITACTATAAVQPPSARPVIEASPGAASPTVSARPTAAPTLAPTAKPRLSPPATAGGPAPDFVACMVAGPDGIHDKGANAESLKGMEAVKKARDIQTHVLEGPSGHQMVDNVNTFAGQTCDIIVGVGFQLDDAVAGAAAKYPDQRFSMVDYAYDPTDEGYVSRVSADMAVSREQVKRAFGNVRGLLFEPGQAAMLAGYLAAGSSKTGRVGVFGAMDTPGVTAFMDGLAAGVHYYNKQKGKTVQLLGWDAVGQTGTFTGDFSDATAASAAALQLMTEGADVIVPVTGPASIGAAQAVHDAKGRRNLLIGVEFDQFVATPQYGNVILTSILKQMDNAVHTTIDQAVDGIFEGGVYHGTLANGGVGLAPYHDLEKSVPPTMAAEIESLRVAIVDGSVTVTDFLAPAH